MNEYICPSGELAETIPHLPQAEVKSYCARYFRHRELYLEKAKQANGACYLLDRPALKERAQQFQTTFSSVLPHVASYYAVKSNNYPEIARTMLYMGFGLDVSSGSELQMALELNASDIVFSGPGKTEAELALAVTNTSRTTILIDSFGELERLEKIAAEMGQKIRAGVRLTTMNNGLWHKFGILPETLPAFWEKASACRHIQLQGLQFHTSWNLSPTNQCTFIKALKMILCRMSPRFLEHLQFIDVGGGYWPETGEWLQEGGTKNGSIRKAWGEEVNAAHRYYRLPAAGLDVFAEDLGQLITAELLPLVKHCRICFEPGRWLCHDAMHLLLQVVDKKAEDLVITDAGTNAIGWERFESDYFPVLNLSRPALVEKPCHILGSLCTPHDVWGYAYWGEGIESGDILMIPTQGAYTYSLRQHFIKPLPPVLAI